MIRLPDGTLCYVDGQPTADNATLCSDCTTMLEKALAELPALTEDLETMLSRQTASGQRNGPRSSEKPLPYDVGASAALGDIRSKVVGWVRDLHEGEPRRPLPGPIHDHACGHSSCVMVTVGLPARWPTDTVAGMTVWLLERIERIRHHEAADEVHREILDASEHGRRVRDRHAPDKVYAGLCGSELHGVECDTPIYAWPGAEDTACPTCGALHKVEERREQMRAAVVDMVLPAAGVAGAVTALWGKRKRDDEGWEQISASAVRNMAHRNAIVAHAHDTRNGRNVPLYRVGDVLVRVLAREAVA